MPGPVFLAVGHGREPNGVYDPGAIGTDGRQEHLEAYQVCQYAATALTRSGVPVVTETAMGASHDPDYRGSALRANALGARLAIEVHFDWNRGVPGFSGLYLSEMGRVLAGKIGAQFRARDLPRAADVHRGDLFFLNATNMTALIPEIQRVHDYPDDINHREGEGLAAGICAYLGHLYKPAQPPAPVERHFEVVGPENRHVFTAGEMDRFFQRQRDAHASDPAGTLTAWTVTFHPAPVT